MATLALLDSSPATTAAAHRVRAPGGYEIWRFTAFDPSRKSSVAVSFHLGLATHQYLRRYMRFRRWPTRFAPPLPREYPAVRAQIRAPYCPAAWTNRFDPAMVVDFNPGRIQIGPNYFSVNSDGAIQLCCRGIELIFRPISRCEPLELSPATDTSKGEFHRWLIGGGLYEATGTIRIGNAQVPFAGLGFRDQQFGTAPVFQQSLRGHLFLKEKAVIFQHIGQMQIITCGTNGVAIEEASASSGTPMNYTGWGLSYPRTIHLNEDLVLANPRVVDSKPASAQVVYEVTRAGETFDALCEIASPRRLAWPIVGGLLALGNRAATKE